MLKGRLERLAQLYREQFGVDVRDLPGTGAAGGLAGGLVALGGRLQPGFDLVADEIDLHDKIADADLVITGEGYLDEQSFEGKVIGGVQQLCEAAGRRVAAVVGDSAESVRDRIEHRSIARDHGLERAMREPLWCIEHSARELLRTITEAAPN
jgi:glycerate kinase